MPSPESVEIRKTLTKDKLEPNIPIATKRQEWEDYALSIPLPADIFLKYESIAGVSCLWVRSATCVDGPIIVYCHGGGLVEGSANTTRDLGARIVKTTNIPILIIDYRLAPEHPFPAALNDVCDVYQALLQQHDFNPKQIIFGGDSNGGGLALAALINLRDGGRPLPTGLFLISPVLDLTFAGESMHSRAAIDPFTSQAVLIHCADLYAPHRDLTNPLISPLFADLSGLPPTLVQVGDHEILLSDSVRFAEKASQFSVDVTLKVWDAMWHVWHYFADLPEAQAAIDQIAEFLHDSLSS